MLQLTKCKYVCRKYRVSSIICKGYISLCPEYRSIVFMFNRIEILNGKIDELIKKEKHNKGLNKTDGAMCTKLEYERLRITNSLDSLGVTLEW